MPKIKVYFRQFICGIFSGFILFTLFLLDMASIVSFISQLLSNIFGTIIAGFILYYLLESKVSKQIEKRNIQRYFDNLIGDLIYNYVGIEKMFEKKEEMLTTNQFTISPYHLRGIEEFIYQRPIDNEEKFPYMKGAGILRQIEGVNFLISLVFKSSPEDVVLKNKNNVFTNSQRLYQKIAEFLLEIEPFVTKYTNKKKLITDTIK